MVEENKKDDLIGLKPPISFVPHLWGQIWKFKLFHSSTYSFSQDVESAISGTYEHFDRYITLMNLSKRLVHGLDKDYEELIKKGYSTAICYKELAAIVDSMFCELYSSVDCTRTVIAAVYGNYRCVPSDSTSRLFKYAAVGKLSGNQVKKLVHMDERVPIEIRKALADGHNDWFPKLKNIRDAINHSSIGYCSDLERRKKGELEPKISYFHRSLADKEGNILVAEDIFKTLSDYEVKVNLFLGSVYYALNQTLKDEETTQVCGIFNGRAYLRLVSPYEAIDFNSGRCRSREWFEKEDQPTCPYVNICGAYVKNENVDCLN